MTWKKITNYDSLQELLQNENIKKFLKNQYIVNIDIIISKNIIISIGNYVKIKGIYNSDPTFRHNTSDYLEKIIKKENPSKKDIEICNKFNKIKMIEKYWIVLLENKKIKDYKKFKIINILKTKELIALKNHA